MVCEDFGLIGINCNSIQKIKFNYGKLGRHVAKKKRIQDPCSKKKKNSNLKNPKVGIQKNQKSEIKTANKTSTSVDVLLHDIDSDLHDIDSD